jgi:chemotaxis family two-component system sensor histidine kinase/response regulator PixL
MAINPDIRDQAYQFFIQEAPELLQVIETGLLSLQQERNTAKVHDLMRAAHSIKGGASSVGLEAIATLAHRLENIFKALYSDTLEIDAELEEQLLQAYDCLRLPLMLRITMGSFNAEQALAIAEPIFSKIEERCGDALTQTENYIPSSSDLGIDMISSILEIDVAQGLERLAAVVANPQDYEVAGELRAQVEVFAGFAELMNLAEFEAIAETVKAALEANPDRVLEITKLAMADFEHSRQAVLTGKTNAPATTQTPSAALSALTVPAATPSPSVSVAESVTLDAAIPLLEDIFGSGNSPFEPPISIQNLSEISDPKNSEESSEIEIDQNQPDPAESEAAVNVEWIAYLSESAEAEILTSYEEVQLHEEKNFTDNLAINRFTGSVELAESIESVEYNDAEQNDAEQNDADQNDADQNDAKSSDFIQSDPEHSQRNDVIQSDFEHSQPDEPIYDESTYSEFSYDKFTDGEPVEGIFADNEFVDDEFVNNAFTEGESADDESVNNAFTEGESVDSLFTESESANNESIDSPSAVSEFIESEFVSGSDPDFLEQIDPPDNLKDAIQSIEQIFSRLPSIENLPQSAVSPNAETDQSSPPSPAEKGSRAAGLVPSQPDQSHSLQVSSRASSNRAIQPHPSSAIAPDKSARLQPAASPQLEAPIQQGEAVITPNLTVRVSSERLERMNNLVGELAINRDGLSLQNEQLQAALRELLSRFSRFRDMVSHLRGLSDHMLVEPERRSYQRSSFTEARDIQELKGRFPARAFSSALPSTVTSPALAEFDPLEMDSYGVLHTQIQEILEDIAQLEETVDDVALFAGQSNQTLNQQRNMLTQLRDELIWARMFPLSEVLNRFPRMMRDLSITYHKPVSLKLSGTSVLVDKAILEKLFDPLLHLLRNAFDHGIEPANVRRQRGKPEQGQIEVRAYHKGNQTIVQVRDDGQGLDLNRIRSRAIALGWLSPEQVAAVSPAQLYELIFEPGFSTARQVTELSGRGVGLDVVRSQLRSIKGTVTVTSTPGQGSIFTLHLPLTLTIAKLVICLVDSIALALPADSIDEILTPQPGQVQQSGSQRYLNWREQIIPTYRVSDLFDYACPLPETPPSKALSTISLPKDWALPMLVLRQDQQVFALEVDRLVTEQELVIKPFGLAIAPPHYVYGCTILGDGSLVPVIDGAALLALSLSQPTTATLITEAFEPMPAIQSQDTTHKQPPIIKTAQTPTVLVIDDSATLRRTVAISLERSGFRVLQARDGREALDQLQHATVQVIVCDIEMPNMNGFEFLSHRRKDEKLANIPIVMLTSRGNEKHRWLATQLGASAYFTKPYLEQELLTTLKSIINTSSKALQAASH